MSLKQDAYQMIAEAVQEVLPDQAVKQALKEKSSQMEKYMWQQWEKPHGRWRKLHQRHWEAG